jgi:hypothetical protein
VSKPPRDAQNPPPDELTPEHVARLEKALAEALARSEAAEAKLEDQQVRLNALGSGREESMRSLAEARDELRRVSVERDELRKQLQRVDSVQTATIALPDVEDASPSMLAAELPSLEDLMVALGNIEMPAGGPDGILHQRVHSDSHDSRDGEERIEMISPELVFPEKYAATAGSKDAGHADTSRLLVLLDTERPVKYGIHKETMTIGRADIADIQIDNGFLSRLHARIVSTPEGVTIEDMESKNGIRVNGKLTPRQALRHGDVIDLGRLRFRYIDASADDVD